MEHVGYNQIAFLTFPRDRLNYLHLKSVLTDWHTFVNPFEPFHSGTKMVATRSGRTTSSPPRIIPTAAPTPKVVKKPPLTSQQLRVQRAQEVLAFLDTEKDSNGPARQIVIAVDPDLAWTKRAAAIDLNSLGRPKKAGESLSWSLDGLSAFESWTKNYLQPWVKHGWPQRVLVEDKGDNGAKATSSETDTSLPASTVDAKSDPPASPLRPEIFPASTVVSESPPSASPPRSESVLSPPASPPWAESVFSPPASSPRPESVLLPPASPPWSESALSPPAPQSPSRPYESAPDSPWRPDSEDGEDNGDLPVSKTTKGTILGNHLRIHKDTAPTTSNPDPLPYVTLNTLPPAPSRPPSQALPNASNTSSYSQLNVVSLPTSRVSHIPPAERPVSVQDQLYKPPRFPSSDLLGQPKESAPLGLPIPPPSESSTSGIAGLAHVQRNSTLPPEPRLSAPVRSPMFPAPSSPTSNAGGLDLSRSQSQSQASSHLLLPPPPPLPLAGFSGQQTASTSSSSTRDATRVPYQHVALPPPLSPPPVLSQLFSQVKATFINESNPVTTVPPMVITSTQGSPSGRFTASHHITTRVMDAYPLSCVEDALLLIEQQQQQERRRNPQHGQNRGEAEEEAQEYGQPLGKDREEDARWYEWWSARQYAKWEQSCYNDPYAKGKRQLSKGKFKATAYDGSEVGEDGDGSGGRRWRWRH